MYRSALVAAWALAALVAAAPAPLAAEEFPYVAYVVSDDVYVRSGPGQSYYPTSKLKQGDTVEVYRHDPGGWFAIRPPEGSFSWISGRYLEPGDEGVATIVADRVVARVGSQFSDVKDVIQVRLNRDEPVELLEANSVASAVGNQSWYKVAPVAGEFRWVSGKFLSLLPATPADGLPPPRRNLLIDRDDDDEPNYPESASRGPATAAEHGPPATLVSRGSRTGGDAETGNSAGFRPATSAARPDPADSDRATLWRAPQTAAASGTSTTSGTSGNTNYGARSWQQELEEIDLTLSAMVTEEPTSWSFDELLSRARNLVTAAPTAAQRQQSEQLLARLQRFDQLRAEQAAVVQAASNLPNRLAGLTPLLGGPATTGGSGYGPAANPSPLGSGLFSLSNTLSAFGLSAPTSPIVNPVPNSLAAPPAGFGNQPGAGSLATVPAANPGSLPMATGAANGQSNAAPGTMAGTNSPYDAQGRLTVLPFQRLGAPQFALVDDQGTVRTYVTPSPGVNLRPYVGRQVGLVGFRGVLPDSNAPHLTARRVSPISGVTTSGGSILR